MKTGRLIGGFTAAFVAATLTSGGMASAKTPSTSLQAKVVKLQAQLRKDGAEIKAYKRQIASLEAALKKATAPPPPPPPTTVPPVIFSQSGSGSASTVSFHVPKAWQLHWSYDCSSFGMAGDFSVEIQPPGGVDFSSPLTSDQGVNQGPSMGSNGVEHYYAGDTDAVLQISSECNWSVQVTPA